VFEGLHARADSRRFVADVKPDATRNADPDSGRKSGSAHMKAWIAEPKIERKVLAGLSKLN
jgi:hypothetical protein